MNAKMSFQLYFKVHSTHRKEFMSAALTQDKTLVLGKTRASWESNYYCLWNGCDAPIKLLSKAHVPKPRLQHCCRLQCVLEGRLLFAEDGVTQRLLRKGDSVVECLAISGGK